MAGDTTKPSEYDVTTRSKTHKTGTNQLSSSQGPIDSDRPSKTLRTPLSNSRGRGRGASSASKNTSKDALSTNLKDNTQVSRTGTIPKNTNQTYINTPLASSLIQEAHSVNRILDAQGAVGGNSLQDLLGDQDVHTYKSTRRLTT